GFTTGPEDQWVEVTPNTPLTVGDRLYASEDSQASIAFTGRNFARLEPNSSLDVVSLGDRRTQVALRDGSAFVSVLSGLAQVVGLAGSGQISKGEMLTLLGQTAAEIALSRLSPDYAGGLLDDYYGYQYPNLYDGRYQDYDAYLSDPDYYDPYNRYDSYRYLPASVPGAYDLDQYGDWQNLGGYGHAWSPRADAGWAPYQQGYWTVDDPYGLTWVSNEPWGYAPYHYGRWLNVNDRWFWLPDAADAQPAYSPALVAFLPSAETNQIAWVPLGPGDPYTRAYYDENWQPHYLEGPQVTPERVVNLGVPGALTVVSAEDFERPVERAALARFDPRAYDRARPVLDPLSHAMLRQASLETAAARRGFVLPPGLAKRLGGTPVYVSAPPAAAPFKDRARRALRLEVVPEKQKKEKLRFKDERHTVAALESGAVRAEKEDGRLRRQEKAQERFALRGESRQQELRQSREHSPQELRQSREHRARPEAERPLRRAEQFAQGERVGLTRQAQREAERQQVRAAREQQRAHLQQQAEVRRQAQQQAAQQRAQQQRAQQQAHAQRSQRKQETPRAFPQQQRRQAETRQTSPQPPAHVPRGQMRKQQAPAQHSPRPAQGPPRGGGPKDQGHGGKGNGKGKGRP
ncbi:MAG TPA: DUF6600 domain-containing protein, partial [Pyrinomonadaceae bacterium]|nr:DUF6600 domain-containing protein [Pyrinomonadaceae bacterium]